MLIKLMKIISDLKIKKKKTKINILYLKSNTKDNMESITNKIEPKFIVNDGILKRPIKNT